MNRFVQQDNTRFCSKPAGLLRPRAALAFVVACLSGCGGNSSSKTVTKTTQTNPQTYFAPTVAGTQSGVTPPLTSITTPSIFQFDDSADAQTFSQQTFLLQPPQEGIQVLNAGILTTGQGGLRTLSIRTTYTDNAGTYVPTTYSAMDAPGGFAIELSGQAGGLVQLMNQPATPLVPATTCPSLAKSQTYNFVTIPGPATNAVPSSQLTFNPMTDAAYGSVDVSTTGSTVSFQNLKQFTLPANGNASMPVSLAQPLPSASCGPTPYGNTISLPGVVNYQGGGATQQNQATLGIGPTGLLIEDAGQAYNNARNLVSLGAGSGVIGLPSSTVSASTVTGAQYLGFAEAVGEFIQGTGAAPFSSQLVSFGGFSDVATSCAAFLSSIPSTAPTPSTSTVYGGDFNPSTTSTPGNCDFAIDLGPQSSTNGLFTSVNVYVGANYPSNPTPGATYSFSAVAIAGQLDGKNAIFVLGEDSTQPWSIYLLQSS